MPGLMEPGIVKESTMTTSTVEKKKILLRPHHALCAAFFEGKGYDAAFVRHMQETLELLDRDDPEVSLTDGCDELCSACPHRKNGQCETDAKARGIDERAFTAMELKTGESLTWRELSEKAKEKVILSGKLKDVCRECEWIGICAK